MTLSQGFLGPVAPLPSPGGLWNGLQGQGGRVNAMGLGRSEPAGCLGQATFDVTGKALILVMEYIIIWTCLD